MLRKYNLKHSSSMNAVLVAAPFADLAALRSGFANHRATPCDCLELSMFFAFMVFPGVFMGDARYEPSRILQRRSCRRP